MIIQSPELLNQLALWRQKSTDGTITLNEMREAVKIIRANRESAGDAAKASKTKKTPSGPAKSASDLLGELNGL